MQETADLVIFTEKILLEQVKYFCVSEAFILNLNNPLIRFR